MRTTLDLDDDVLEAARSLARAQGRSVGAVLSDLARKGLSPAVRGEEGPGGFPTLVPAAGTPALTIEAVRTALDDDDLG